jgi:hypothetical protein
VTTPITGPAFKLILIRLPGGKVHYEVTDGTCPVCGGTCMRQNVNGRLSCDASYRYCTNQTCTWTSSEPKWLPGMVLSDDHERLIAEALVDVRKTREGDPR